MQENFNFLGIPKNYLKVRDFTLTLRNNEADFITVEVDEDEYKEHVA